MKVTLIHVTWNRLELVKKYYEHNLANKGADLGEIVWVDNGSTDGTVFYALSCKPDVLILNKENRGLPVGVNGTYALATGDSIVFTGDTLMPDNWLKNMVAVMDESKTDFVCYYTAQGMTFTNRILGEEQKIAGCTCKPCMPFETIMFNRSLLKKVGYFREEFGLYGWCDEEWFLRMHSMGCKGFVIADALAVHEGLTGACSYADGHGETKEYWEFKHAQCSDPNKLALLESFKNNGYSYYSPF